MKGIKIFTLMLIAFSLGSCELSKIDNYEGPDASISGGIYDEETGELIEQDIINGMQIEYVEHGFDNPEIQYMVVKNDGTYQNDLMFSGDYTIQPVRGNFVPLEAEEITVGGQTVKDFEVQPYIRIHNTSIEKENNTIVATFNLEQTVPNNVSRIGLFAHSEPNVGNPLNSVASVLDINAVTNEEQSYRLEINLDAHPNALEPGKQYYFRVGALIEADEAKFNYAPAVRITI